jgi:hypothetical protein
MEPPFKIALPTSILPLALLRLVHSKATFAPTLPSVYTVTSQALAVQGSEKNRVQKGKQESPLLVGTGRATVLSPPTLPTAGWARKRTCARTPGWEPLRPQQQASPPKVVPGWPGGPVARQMRGILPATYRTQLSNSHIKISLKKKSQLLL